MKKQNQVWRLVGLLQPPNVTVLTLEIIHNGNPDIPCDVLMVSPDLKWLWALLVGNFWTW